MNAPLLAVENLWVRFLTAHGRVTALRGVDFAMGREKVGVVGESGSGKSTLARAVIRLCPGEIRAQRLAFDGVDLLRQPERVLRRLRGARIGFVPQDPAFALNPVLPVGEQIAETLRAHRAVSRHEAQARTLDLMAQVGLAEPDRLFRRYPHELSGGMGQRAAIAMMMIAEPDLLIADEPTSALDLGVRLKVLRLLDDLVARRGMGLLFISHDLDLVAGFCDRVLVMYGGRILETLPASELERARHPYTRGLLAARPKLETPQEVLPVLERDPAWLEETVGSAAP